MWSVTLVWLNNNETWNKNNNKKHQVCKNNNDWWETISWSILHLFSGNIQIPWKQKLKFEWELEFECAQWVTDSWIVQSEQGNSLHSQLCAKKWIILFEKVLILLSGCLSLLHDHSVCQRLTIWELLVYSFVKAWSF